MKKTSRRKPALCKTQHIEVRCLTDGCASHGQVINRIRGFKNWAVLFDVIEQWAESHEDADICPQCKNLGNPTYVAGDQSEQMRSNRKTVHGLSWLTDNDRLRATAFREKLLVLTLEQLAAFVNDLQCVVDEAREYACENESLVDALARQDGDAVHARWFAANSSVAAEYDTRAKRVIAAYASTDLNMEPDPEDLDWLVDRCEVNGDASSQRISDVLDFSDGVPPYRAVPGKSPQAVNQQVVVEIKGGLGIKAICPPGVECLIHDHDLGNGRAHETVHGPSMPPNG